MKSHIIIDKYDGADLVRAETRLRKQGYRLVRKKSENDLRPGEYIRQEHFFPANPSGNRRRGTLRWRTC